MATTEERTAGAASTTRASGIGSGRVRILAILVLAAAVAAVWTGVVVGAPTAHLTVAFIGDSYTGGSDMGGNGEQNYTSIVANEMGWTTLNFAKGGTGYVKSGGPGAQPFEAQQLDDVVAARPDIVVVVGSRNDIDETEPAITEAAEHLYASLKTRLPDTKLLVVGPIWPGDAPQAMDRVRSAVLAAATAESVPVVDPIADRWLNDGTADLIGSDGIHPNDAGHAYLAEHMITVLERSTTISR